MTTSNRWTPAYPFELKDENIEFSPHAISRQHKRHISKRDVLLTLILGEWQFAPDRAIYYSCNTRTIPLRRRLAARQGGVEDMVVILDFDTCEIITVYRQDDPDEKWSQVKRQSGPRPS